MQKGPDSVGIPIFEAMISEISPTRDKQVLECMAAFKTSVISTKLFTTAES
jgi:hypothetical protein